MYLHKYGVARHIYVPMVKRGLVDFAVSADWTPAAGDVKISKDGGAFANVTNLPTAIASANTGAVWDFSLTATEMQAAQVIVVVSDAATKAVEDQAFEIETYGNASGQHVFDLSQATPNANTLTIDPAAVTSIWGKAMVELSAAPGITGTVLQGLEWLFALARNKRTQTATTETLYKDDGTTVESQSTKSDDGTTFTRGKFT